MCAYKQINLKNYFCFFRYHESSLAYSSNTLIKNKLLRTENRKENIEKSIYQVPDVLQTLIAFQYYDKLERISTDTNFSNVRSPLNYSDCNTPIGLIKYGMLLVFSALPLGSLDDQDDRWGGGVNNTIGERGSERGSVNEDLLLAWRDSIISNNDYTTLMQSQIMFEYGIKTSWFSPMGLKLITSLPSRSHSLRFPSLGLLALRLFTFDKAIRYDKIVLPGDKNLGNSVNRGRPKGVGNNPTGARKKKKTF